MDRIAGHIGGTASGAARAFAFSVFAGGEDGKQSHGLRSVWLSDDACEGSADARVVL